jgi:hypothetical protein
VFSLDGKLENEIVLPASARGGFGGLNDDKYVFYSFTSFNFPPTIYKYDIATKKSTVFRTVDIPGFKPRTTKPSRSSTTAKTARACRCSWSTRKAQARRQQSDAALRLRRFQRRHRAVVQLAAHGIARTGRGFMRSANIRGRRRVRREVARSRHEA